MYQAIQIVIKLIRRRLFDNSGQCQTQTQIVAHFHDLLSKTGSFPN